MVKATGEKPQNRKAKHESKYKQLASETKAKALGLDPENRQASRMANSTMVCQTRGNEPPLRIVEVLQH